MSPISPLSPREEQEIQILALLLDELPPAEAESLRAQLAQDPNLQRYYDQLRNTVPLVRAATSPTPDAATPPNQPVRLSSPRRETLLRSFKTVDLGLPPIPRRRPNHLSWILPISLAACLVTLFGLIGLFPEFTRATSSSRSKALPLTPTLTSLNFESPPQPERRLAVNPAPELTLEYQFEPEASLQQLDRTDRLAESETLARAPIERYRQATGFAKERGASTGDDLSSYREDPNQLGRRASPPPPPQPAQTQPIPRAQDKSQPDLRLGDTPQVGDRFGRLAGGLGGFGGGGGGGGIGGGGGDAGGVRFDEAAEKDNLARQAQNLFAERPHPRDMFEAQPADTTSSSQYGSFYGRPSAAPDQNDRKKLLADNLELAESIAVNGPQSSTAMNRGFSPSPAKPASPASSSLSTNAIQAESSPWFENGLANRPATPAAGLPAINAPNTWDFAHRTPPTPIRSPAPPTAKAESMSQLDSLQLGLQPAPSKGAETKQRTAGAAHLALSPPPSGSEPASANPEDVALVVAPSPTTAEALTPLAKIAPLDAAEGRVLDERRHLERLSAGEPAAQPLAGTAKNDIPLKRPTAAPIPQPEIPTAERPFSTFSLNVSDVSFKLAEASLQNGAWPDPAAVRTEEFLNAFNYRDPEPPPGSPIAFTWEQARYPFAHNRDLLRFSVKTAARGREPGRPLNLVLLLDNSGSMERADRVEIVHACLRILATQLAAQDKLSVVTFSRTAQLRFDGRPGPEAAQAFDQLRSLTPEGGTNLEDALQLAYATARRHFLDQGVNRVVLLTDGAANLGNVNPLTLKRHVEDHRRQGIALDCFGIGWEGYADDLLATLTRHGDGRYGFINSPTEAAAGFASQLAGALQVAASDVKVQVEFNPQRITAYRQLGYAQHQLTKEQFRDNTVDAAEIGAAESGNALYLVQLNPQGHGDLGLVRVRFKIPGTSDYREQAWPLPYRPTPPPLAQANPTLRLAATAAAFAEWLVASPFAAEITPDALLPLLHGVPQQFPNDPRPQQLERMIRQAKSLRGQ